MHALPRGTASGVSLLLYLTLSLLFFGRLHGYGSNVLGYGGDSFTSVWCLRWWPWAIVHGINPFVSHKVWSPEGIDLTWVTSTPALSLIGLPLTLVGGPIVTFNTLALLSPVLAAWTAFLLARHVTRSAPAGFVAGYLYGFSPYEVGHLLGHLNLMMTCMVPLLLLVCLKRLSGEIARRRCMLLLALGLLVQFGISLEVLCTACLFGAVSWLVFLAFVTAPLRRRLVELAIEFVAAAAVVGVLASPFLFFLLRGMRNLPPVLNAPEGFSADPLGFIVPGVLTRIGSAYFAVTAQRFTGGAAEQTACLGLPLILILTASFARRPAMPAMRAMLLILLLLVLCSLGPRLWIDGTQTGLRLPWAMFEHVPLIRSALPGRFTLYIFLLSGLAVASWLAEAAAAKVRARRFALAVVACLFLLPDPATTRHWTSAGMLPFFDEARAGALLGPGRTALLLPFGALGANMIWQSQAGFSFDQAAGYTGLIPPSEAAEPVIGALNSGRIVPGMAALIVAYCRARRVSAIVAGPDTAPPLMAVLRTTGWPASRQGGATMFSDPRAPFVARVPAVR